MLHLKKLVCRFCTVVSCDFPLLHGNNTPLSPPQFVSTSLRFAIPLVFCTKRNAVFKGWGWVRIIDSLVYSLSLSPPLSTAHCCHTFFYSSLVPKRTYFLSNFCCLIRTSASCNKEATLQLDNAVKPHRNSAINPSVLLSLFLTSLHIFTAAGFLAWNYATEHGRA
jgi:hypothetical protein